MFKESLFIAAAVLAAVAAGPLSSAGKASAKEGVVYANLYKDIDEHGEMLHVVDYINMLDVYGFNDEVESTCLNGVWVFYEHDDYNADGGTVYWIIGINYCTTFDVPERNLFSSIKYVGSPNNLNADTLTLYQGTYFTGMEFYAFEDVPNLQSFTNLASSVMVTGSSPWTLYSGEGYTGESVCLYPDTNSITVNDQKITLGAHGQLSQYGFDNNVRSFAKGCFSKDIVKAKLAPLGSSSNGAWGKFA
ncbi:uncharacterized protein LOC122261911 [Penaeus japonicus]|uniref:uncharacterized protein LOC122261911 n=1 Tax=Penaeus japonicus TaxID=27405 RepID=UPI001C70E13F|nr:uncharacterized protein LOC122261911 [Penaeus japonicus]